MNEACDRCGPAVRAAYRVHNRGELYLCRHCAARLWPALSSQGWAIYLVNGLALAPQARGESIFCRTLRLRRTLVEFGPIR